MAWEAIENLNAPTVALRAEPPFLCGAFPIREGIHQPPRDCGGESSLTVSRDRLSRSRWLWMVGTEFHFFLSAQAV